MNRSPAKFAARRREIIQEVGQARADYAHGKVSRGFASTLMRELRRKAIVKLRAAG